MSPVEPLPSLPPPPPPPPMPTFVDLTNINTLEDLWSGRFSIDVSDATMVITDVQYAILKEEVRAAVLSDPASSLKVDVLLFASALHRNAKKGIDSLTCLVRARVLKEIHDKANSNCKPDENSVSVQACSKLKLVTLLGKTVRLTNEKRSFEGRLLHAKRSHTNSMVLRVAQYEVAVNAASLADGTVIIQDLDGEEEWQNTDA